MASRLSGGGRLPLPQRRLLVACGAGAGYAVAYNVPFGAALFALEVILGELSLTLLIPALLTTSLATVVSWIFLPNQPTYTIPHYDVTVPLVVWAFVAGPLFGLCSVGFIRAIAFAHKLRPHGWRLLLTPVLVLTALGRAAIAFPELLGNGKDVVELSFNGDIGLMLLLVLPALKLLATASCLGSGCAGRSVHARHDVWGIARRPARGTLELCLPGLAPGVLRPDRFRRGPGRGHARSALGHRAVDGADLPARPARGAGDGGGGRRGPGLPGHRSAHSLLCARTPAKPPPMQSRQYGPRLTTGSERTTKSYPRPSTTPSSVRACWDWPRAAGRCSCAINRDR